MGKKLSLFWSTWTDELPEGCCVEKLRVLIYTFMIHIHKDINVDSLLLEICFWPSPCCAHVLIANTIWGEDIAWFNIFSVFFPIFSPQFVLHLMVDCLLKLFENGSAVFGIRKGWTFSTLNVESLGHSFIITASVWCCFVASCSFCFASSSAFASSASSLLSLFAVTVDINVSLRLLHPLLVRAAPSLPSCHIITRFQIPSLSLVSLQNMKNINLLFCLCSSAPPHHYLSPHVSRV